MKSITIFFLLYISTITRSEEVRQEIPNNGISEEETINPHSFHYDRHTKQMQNLYDSKFGMENPNLDAVKERRSVETLCPEKLQKCMEGKKEEETYKVYYQRLLNVLLHHADLKRGSDEDTLKGNIILECTSAQLDLLHNYKSGKVSIRAVDDVLSRMIKKPEKSFHNFAFSYVEILLQFLMNNPLWCLYYIASLMVSIIMYMCIKRSRFLTAFAVFVISISWFITHLDLLQQEEINLTMKQMQNIEIPISCQPHKMTWYQRIYYTSYIFGNNKECQKYIQGRMENPQFKVSPLQSFSKMISESLLLFVSSAGSHINRFLSDATADMNFFMSSVTKPLLLIGIILGVISSMIILFVLFYGKFKCYFGPFLSFGLSGNHCEEKRCLPRAIKQNVKTRHMTHAIQDRKFIKYYPKKLNTVCKMTNEDSEVKKSINENGAYILRNKKKRSKHQVEESDICESSDDAYYYGSKDEESEVSGSINDTYCYMLEDIKMRNGCQVEKSEGPNDDKHNSKVKDVRRRVDDGCSLNTSTLLQEKMNKHSQNGGV